MKNISNKNVKIKFNGTLDGQFRKDASNDVMRKLFPNFKFIPLKEGLKRVYDKLK